METTRNHFSTSRKQGKPFRNLLRPLKRAALRIGVRKVNTDWTDAYAKRIIEFFANVHHIRTLEIYASTSTALIEKLNRNEIDVVAVLQPIRGCLTLPPGVRALQPLKTARPVAVLLEDVEGGDVFTSLLWSSWGGRLITVLAMLVAAFRLSSMVHWRLRPDHHAWTLSDIVMWAVAAIAQQGTTKHPKGLSCRVMFTLGYAMTNLMYTAFAAAVCSLLATAADAPEWQLRQPLGWENFRQLGKVAVDAATFQRISQMEEVADTETAMRLVLSGTVQGSLSVDEEVMRVLRADILGLDACRLRVAPLIGETSPLPTSLQYSLIVARDSVLATEMETWFVRLRESGLQKRLENQRRLLCDVLNNGFQSAGFAHVGSAVFIFVTGVLLAVMLLFLEKAIFAERIPGLCRAQSQNDKKKSVEPVKMNPLDLRGPRKLNPLHGRTRKV